VYGTSIESDPAVDHHEIFKAILANERRINGMVREHLEQHKVSYVDLLPELQARAGGVQLYPGNYDGHPNKNGYRVIAESVAAHLQLPETCR
jgi:lysophospholipase L1-like esterase